MSFVALKAKDEPSEVVQRIVLKSAFDQVGVDKKLHVARFVGFGDAERFTPAKLNEPVEMRRVEPPPVVERPMNPRKARAKYQVTDISKSAPLVVDPNDESVKRHQKLVLTAAPSLETKPMTSASSSTAAANANKRQIFDGQLEAGQTSQYVVFVSRGAGEFSVMPVADWYNFKKRSLAMQDKANVSIDAIERHIKQQRRTDRFLMPKSSLTGRDAADDLEARDEPMDPVQYAARHAPRFEDEDIRADPDADINAAVSDDEGDGAAHLARPDDERQAASELKVVGAIADDAVDDESRLTETGKRMRKLLERDDADSTSDDAEEDDDEEEDADEADDDDKNDKNKKLSGQKRKGVPESAEVFDLAHGKRVRQSGLPVQVPNVVNEAEMLRVVRESGALQLGELLDKFRALLKDQEQNKLAFKQVLRKLTDDGQLVFTVDADGLKWCHVTRK